MTVGISSKLKKIKKRRMLMVYSGGGFQGSIQCLYISMQQNTWELISHISLPFTHRINTLYGKIQNSSIERFTIDDISILDYRITQFCLEAIKTLITPLPTPLKKPHYIVFNKPQIWRGLNGESEGQNYWDFSSGDPQLIASTIKAPVYTDFIRNNILSGGPGILPLNPGALSIASRIKGKVILINIGMISHITIVNADDSRILADSDVGPGTCLLNQFIADINSSEGFDRDGSMASQGKVDSNCVESLASFDWFGIAPPKFTIAETFTELLRHESLQALSPQDKVATLTALTARIIYDFCKKEFITQSNDLSIYISGGGANNQTLLEYLTTYFDPLPVKTVEEIGVPVDLYIPLAFGLTVDACVTGNAQPWQGANTPVVSSIGRWVIP